jgi:hypothetical protein
MSEIYSFQNIKDNDVDTEYSILCERVHYLHSEGIKQYLQNDCL